MKSLEEISDAIEQAYFISDNDTLTQLSKEAAEYPGLEGAYWSKRALMFRAFSQEDHQATVTIGYESLELARQAGLRLEEAAVTGTIALVHTVTGDYAQALDLFHRSLAINTELDSARGIGFDLSNIGLTYSHLGELEKALDYMERAIALFREHDHAVFIARTSAFIAEVYSQLGRFEEAVEIINEGKMIFWERTNPTGVAYNSMVLARVLLEANRLEECGEVLDQLADNPTNYPDAQFETDLVRAKYLVKVHRLDEAEELFLSCLERAEKSYRQAKVVEIFAGLRDIAESRASLKEYIRFNKAYLEAVEELTGKKTTQRIALQEADRRIESERVERERERSVLFSTLPRNIAERVVRGETVTDHYDIATVVFMDIVNFTAKSAGLTAAKLVEVLEGVFDDCDEICATYDLLKIKTIGDSYMAVAFNDQSADPCVVRAVVTTFEMMKIKREWPDGTPIEFRIGLNTGPVVAGIIGHHRIQYDVWGDTVNTASRMESTGEPSRIQVTDEFAKSLSPEITGLEVPGTTCDVGPGWTLESRGTFEVKGKGAMATFWLTEKTQAL